MKAFFLILALILSSLHTWAGKPNYHLCEGEDASSGHHYFLYANEETIEKIRWLWNGGAQNKPIVTEFILTGSTIRITKMTGDRALLPALEAGEEPEMVITSTYTLALGSSDRMLVPMKGNKVLSETQRIDIGNLISILAKNRRSDR